MKQLKYCFNVQKGRVKTISKIIFPTLCININWIRQLLFVNYLFTWLKIARIVFSCQKIGYKLHT